MQTVLIHPATYDSCRAAVDRAFDLFIVDAVIGMEGNGPASTDLREIGLVLAADNGAALDATMARMMGVEPGALPFLRMAAERGLGHHEAEAIRIAGELVPIPGFKLPPAAHPQRAADLPTGEGELFSSRIRLRPKADPSTCTACGLCVDQCPVSALHLQKDIPLVDAKQCIACFCCQEMCPQTAIQLG